ncbi:hypothetical protein [Deinococcus wulumuqiensis]|uniref:hypothetical protein n=1 Tax=Deinococcus wulumuqiensis TaxID=980427 RepID=UPI0024310DDA|nr:hypothetical protein [Deinococcus wulumuqiensis]
MDWILFWTAFTAIGTVGLAAAAFITLQANNKTTQHLQKQLDLMEQQARLAEQQNELIERQIRIEERRDSQKRFEKFTQQFASRRSPPQP